jgi:hypothetical protein
VRARDTIVQGVKSGAPLNRNKKKRQGGLLQNADGPRVLKDTRLIESLSNVKDHDLMGILNALVQNCFSQR